MADDTIVYTVNPAFDRFPGEAQLIGKILAAFGELEFQWSNLASNAVGLWQQVLRALYRLRSTSSRIEAADALMRIEFAKDRLHDEYEFGHGALLYCLKIRNQYAHCNWADHPEAGLFFADLQDAAEAHDGFQWEYRHVDTSLLTAQYQYFAFTMEWLRHLEFEMKFRRGKGNASWPKPREPSRPSLHNDPLAHVPPWLNADAKARHVARAQAAAGGPPTPTPAQQALDAAREAKRFQREEQRRRSVEGNKPNDDPK